MRKFSGQVLPMSLENMLFSKSKSTDTTFIQVIKSMLIDLILHFYCLLGCISCFGPLIVHLLHEDNYYQVYDSNSYHDWLLIGIAISSWKFFDIIYILSKRKQTELDLLLQDKLYIFSILFSLAVFIILFVLFEYEVNIWIANSIITAMQLFIMHFVLAMSQRYENVSSKYYFVLHMLTVTLFVLSENYWALSIVDDDNDYHNRHNFQLSIILFGMNILIQFIYFGIKFSTFGWSIVIPTDSEYIMNHLVYHTSVPIFLMAKFILDLIFRYNSSFFLMERYLFSNYLLAMIYFIVLANLSSIEVIENLIHTKNNVESKKIFFSTMSHEIRSPLSTVNLGVELLIEDLDHALANPISLDPKAIHETLRDIKISCEIAINTLNDLLSLDKIQSSMMELELRRTPCWEFVTHCLRPFYVQARAASINLLCTKGLSVDDYISLDQIGILIDPIRMEQVLRNFLSNALKFSPKRSEVIVKVTILPHFSQSPEKGRSISPGPQGVLRVAVFDQGPGISKENQSKLFGQYVQINANKLQNGKGSGLGLWLAKSIVELHGGIIGAHSDGEGLGACFFFELPCELYDPVHGSSPNVLNVSIRNPKNIIAGRKGSSLMDVSQRKSISSRPLHRNHVVPMGLAFQESDAIANNNQTIMKLAQQRASMRIGGNNVNFLNNSQSKSASQSLQPSGHADTLKANDTRPAAVLPIIPSAIISSTNVDSSRTNPTAIGTVKGFGKRPSGRQHYDDDDDNKLSEISNDDGDMVNKKLNILIVDDSHLGRKMVQKALSEIYDICHNARDGKEALDMVKQNITFYDVVLTDFHMPKMDGPTAVKLMRQAGYLGIIFGVTGAVSAEETDYFVESGVDAVIEKPINLNSFRQMLSSMGKLDS